MPRSEWIGKKLSNRYLIEELLGQGGMSAVYKASDPNLKRVVAIKMIHLHLSSDPDFIMRFEQEASGVAQLRHPRIIQVYDFNQAEGVYYMVLEFVPGENLQDHLRRLNEDGRKLPISKAIEYMIDVCDAVDYAHRRGMIHRDIKPANIMLSLLGEAIQPFQVDIPPDQRCLRQRSERVLGLQSRCGPGPRCSGSRRHVR